MSNLTSVTVTAGVPTAGTGTVSTLDALMADGGQATIGAKADAANSATDTTAISAMSALKQISKSVQNLNATTDVAVTPTVTASGYTANNVIGGIMTFASILPANFCGVLQSITAKFKGTAVSGNITVCVFKASPSNGTYTDKSAATWNAADMANLLGIYQLTTPLALGAATMTVYNLDGIGKAIVGSSTSLYAVVTVGGTPTPASTSDFTLELAVLPG